jgi:large subunit ribosomal protein L25
VEQVILAAELREDTGKSFNKKLRRQGMVPAVVYKAKKPSTNIQVKVSDFSKALKTSAGENVVIKLDIKSDSKKDERTVIIKEIQHEPLKGDVLHIDFNQISLTEVMKFNVPVIAKGEAVGVKVDEGVLSHVVRELEVECLPTDIPESFEVDVTEMKIGDAIKASDIKIPEGIKLLTDPEAVLVTVEPPIKEVVAEVVPEEAAEPEVIMEKKLTPEEEAAAAAEEEKEKKEKKPEAKPPKEEKPKEEGK